MGIFTRDGHLLDLTLERYYAQELTSEEKSTCDQHIQSCLQCQSLFATLQQPLNLPPLNLPTHPRPQLKVILGGPHTPPEEKPPLNRLWWLPLLAIAATALLFLRPSEKEEFTLRGTPHLTLEVFRQTPTISERLTSETPVNPGDKLAFRIQSDTSGYLLISGKDATGHHYPCYPQDSHAAPIQGSPDPLPLPTAIELDGTPGEEILTATHCPTPFDLTHIQNQQLDPHCTQTSLTLHKKSP